jgi:S-DNA-T family DNA segregation ATPase FtsK/SpoIIIE
MVFLRRDLLTEVVAPFPVPVVPDLTALPVGLREDGRVYALRLLATHVLVAGATRSGKGSVIWSVVAALAGGIHSRLVQVWGIDPKGGMELAIGRDLFARLEAADYPAMADMLEHLVTVMRGRQAQLSGLVRVHTPTPAQPLYLLVVDELSALTAYLPDTELRNRILQALGLILSQGAGLGVLVLAATQDPRKQTVALRDLFPTRIALRLTEPGHVNLILGDGARDRGALADQILADPAHRGIGYVQLGGQPEPMRLRFTYLTDTNIKNLARAYSAARVIPPIAPVPPVLRSPAASRAVPPAQRGPTRTSPGQGPLLPPGLRDALGLDDHNDRGAER